MDRRRVCRHWMGVLVGVLGCVAVAQGQTVYTQGADLHVGGDLYVADDITADAVNAYYIGLSRVPDAYLDDVHAGDLDVTGYIGANSPAFGIFTNLIVGYTASCQGDLGVSGDFGVSGNVTVGGKIDAWGGLDPAYILYDRQTRDGIVEKVKKEVSPEKQGGAVLFFNGDTHQLETYVSAEGKFYNLSGAVVQALPVAVTPVTQYKLAYYLDRDSGQVKSFPKPVSNKYRLKSGYRLDEGTGQFIHIQTGQVAAREQAVEFYNAAEQTYYDLQGRALRSERDQKPVEYATQYYFDRQTGEVKQMRKTVRQTYVLKEGFRFDKQTGQFVKEDTSEVVPREAAVVLKQTPSAQTTK